MAIIVNSCVTLALILLISTATEQSLSDEVQHVLRSLNNFNLLNHTTTGSGCKCVDNNCGCCADLDIPKLHIKDLGCVNVSYLPEEYGFRATLTINNVVLMNITISARNPPPICLALPYLEKEASICLDFYNLNISNKTFSGCIKLEARLFHLIVDSVDFGCFHIPIVGKRNIQNAIIMVEGIKGARYGIYTGGK